MIFGIQSAAYLLRYGFLEGAVRMARHGYQAVDYGFFEKTETAFFRQDEESFRRQIQREGDILRSFHITPNQTHGPWRFPPRDATVEDREERFLAMAKAIRGTAYLGAENMVIHPLMPYGENSPLNPQQVYEVNLEFFSRLADVGREYGVCVCLENMPFPNHPIATPSEIVNFVRTIHHPNMKVCLDTGHALVCGVTADEAVHTIGTDLLRVMHLHDNDGTRDAHLAVGEGILDMPSFVKALSKISYRGVISIETMADKASVLTPKERECAELAFFRNVKSFFID